jgi:endoglucanase
MKAKIKKYLTELTSLNGISGFEKEVVVYVRDKIKPYADEVKVDPFGNVTALRKGSSNKPSLMIAAHTDEIGLMVSKIEKNGFLRCVDVGFPNPILLSGRKVNIDGKCDGVVGVRTLHVTPPQERDKLPKRHELFIDVGAKDDKAVMKMGIKVGSPISFLSDLMQLGKGDVYAGKATDDRLGCVLLLLMFEALSKVNLKTPVYGCFTVQEELGLRGAHMSAYNIDPDLAIALDVALAEDTPDQPPVSETSACMGKGPVLNIKEFIPDWAIGAIHHPAFVEFIENVAKKKKIPYQRGVIIGGATDAAAIHLSRGGVPSAYIGPPTRYLHSQVETLDLSDIQHSVNLLVETAKAITPRTKFSLV